MHHTKYPTKYIFSSLHSTGLFTTDVKMSYVGPSQKRVKLDDHAHAHFCPPTNSEDDVSYERNLELLKAEMAKGRPQVDGRTFPNRWEKYCNGESATLLDYLSHYPLLKKAFKCKLNV